MSEISLLVLIEAGQVRSLAGPGFQLPLPDVLIWGPDVLSRIEALTTETEVWPTESQLASAMVIDRDSHRLVRAGASHTFDTPYQVILFDRMLSAAWGYDVEHVALTNQAIAAAARIDLPPIDSKLARQIVARAMGGLEEECDFEDDQHDIDEGEDEYEDEYAYDAEGDDFRQLTTQRVADDSESMLREYEDHNWFVSIRAVTDEPFRHYRGEYVLRTFCDGGPDVIGQLPRLHEISVPKESQAKRGVVVDASKRTLNLWSHPRGVSGWDELDQAWSGWTIQRWHANGYRRQLEVTGEADRVVTPSDLQSLSGFVPLMVEQFDLQEMFGQLKSSYRRFVRRGFGCLAIVLAIPALIAWAVSGGWKGPFAFAATLWVIALVVYLRFAGKIKRDFSSLAEKREHVEEMLPKLAPETKEERIGKVNQVLQAAGLPDFEQIQACAERDDDDNDEPLEPIVGVLGD